MKPDLKVLDVTNTLEGEKIQMGIKQGSMAHIMSLLTNLYKNPVLAVIREYSTNALDSHIEAGVSRPIEVTTPAALSPFFRVRDYGVGLDEEGIREIYSQYGASTKRDSDEVVGMLGLGCKSALTYCDQFTLTGVKNGVATQVAVSYDEDGTGSMTIVDTYETDDPNGVEVVVPAKTNDTHRFIREAKQFFGFWDEGTVLLNGEAPERIDGTWVSDDIVLVSQNQLDGDYIVMGNVPYPVEDNDESYRGSYYNRTHYVAFVEIGAVNFTPSREALMMTAKTKACVAQVSQRAEDLKQEAFAKKIAAAPTALEALNTLFEVSELGFNGDPIWNGSEVPLRLDMPRLPDGSIDKVITLVRRRKGYGSQFEAMTRIDTTTVRKTVWITGYDEEGFTPYKRKKLQQWIEERHEADDKVPSSADYFAFVEDVPQDFLPWIKPDHIRTWAEIKAQKIIRPNSGVKGVSVSGTYQANVAGDYKPFLKADEIDPKGGLYYTHGKDAFGQNRQQVLLTLKPNATIVFLGMNRINKFKRDFPMAQEASSEMLRLAKKWKDSLTPGQKMYLRSTNNSEFSWLKTLDETRIGDPALVEMIGIVKKKNTKLDAQYEVIRRVLDLSNLRGSEAGDNPLTAYPLLQSVKNYGRLDKEAETHLYLYLNAAYAARSES